MNRLQSFLQQGQSIWLDYIERSMLQKGELRDLVNAGLRGVTSNPTIFQQGIGSSDAYTADLQQLVNKFDEPKEIFEHIAIDDIKEAADTLRPTYDEAEQKDGFVSLEVAPDLAHDTRATIAEARRLFNAVDRPNLMIKVPATKAGIPAIRQLISDGLNINVTLIFARDRYAEVKEAFLSGLEDRVKRNEPIGHIASVASFFVSRVDSNVDSRLEDLASSNPQAAKQAQALMGKIAIANAKLAYAQFLNVFDGERWQALAGKGAQLQRPLWASTSTKNPAYPELLYVESLIGPNTVNTLPPKTLEALRDHAEVHRTVDQDLAQAKADIDALEEIGISMAEVTDELEEEGVRKFADSYDDLLATINKRKQEMATA